MAETMASTVPRAGSWEWGAAPGELERMRRKERVVMLGWGWGGWWWCDGHVWDGQLVERSHLPCKDPSSSLRRFRSNSGIPKNGSLLYYQAEKAGKPGNGWGERMG